MRQRRHVAVAVAAFAFALAGCSSSSTRTAGTTTSAGGSEGSVTIQNIAFHPPALNVSVGATVTWHFDDNGVLHTVTADDGSFDAGQHGSGQFSHTFDHAGTFKYHCSIHATMTGSIVVG